MAHSLHPALCVYYVKRRWSCQIGSKEARAKRIARLATLKSFVRISPSKKKLRPKPLRLQPTLPRTPKQPKRLKPKCTIARQTVERYLYRQKSINALYGNQVTGTM